MIVIEQQARDKVTRFSTRFGSTPEIELGDLFQPSPEEPDSNAALLAIVNDPSIDQDIRERILLILEQRLAQ